MRQRLACTLIGAALFLICALVALLFSDALAPGRLPPMLAFWIACGAGGLLVTGLALLDRRGGTDPGGLAGARRPRQAGPAFAAGRQPG